MKKLLILTILICSFSSFAQNLIMNGNMEAGAGGTGVVPTNWSIVQHTPDNCASPPAACPGPSYVINNPSPDAGRWVRFFRGGGWNERFGQYICQPLVAGQSYTLQFWASHSDLNSSANATNTGIDFGFSNGLPGGTGAGGGNSNNVALTTPETWQLVTHTFIAAANYDFISFAKNTTDTQNATYIDGVSLIGALSGVPVLPNDTTLCTGQTLLLDVSTFTGPYTWQDNSVAATFNVTTAGTYYVDLGPAGGCQNTDTIVVTYSAAAAINLGPDQTLCNGQTAILDASAAAAPYLWQDGSTNATFNATVAGQYYVDVGSGACSGSDTVNVSFTAPPLVNLGPDANLCTGDNLLLDATLSGGPFLWQDNSTNGTFNVTTGGTYFIEVGTGTCLGFDTIVVNYGSGPVFTLGNDTTLCTGDNLLLDMTAQVGPFLWQDNSVANSFNVTAPGQYFVEIGTAPCIGFDTINVLFDVYPVIDLGPDANLCAGDNLLLDATPSGGPYLWQDASTSATFNVIAVGQYFVDVGTQCISTDTVNVAFTNAPVFSLGNDTTLCDGEILNLDMSVQAGPFLWQDNSTSNSFNVTTTGTYSVLIGTAPCSATDDIIVTYESYPAFTMGPDANICNGDNIQFDFTPEFGPYLWQDGSTMATFNVTNPGTYWVEIGNLCPTRDSIDINVVTTSLSMNLDNPSNCGPYTVNFTANANTDGGGIQSWDWAFGDGGIGNQQNPSHFYNTSGLYSVGLTVTTVEGCVETISSVDWVQVYDMPVAAFTCSPQNLTTDNAFVTFTDLSINANSWNWSFGSTQGASILQHPNYTYPSSAGNYIASLQVVSADGCVDTTQKQIIVEDALIFYVPNAFTPDGDVYNEGFTPQFTSGIDPYDFHMTIYNRWGEIIFETYNKDLGWNGAYGDGGLVEDGTYVWQFEFKVISTDKKYKHHGHVTVLK
ncbi:MAG: gliding motility-associated-like protein [Arenicella sp.]